ncbi:pentapeptide repeat-containing protein [Streptomyces longisporoflavus]|uniref:Pentapeptide repeat-containing protein n=1 Tax=Streptomyces longisporoflavus TaxID=28044 RepID=A0ABW7QIQ0_9ACTN
MLRRKADRRGLRLWPVGPVLALAFALLVAGSVLYTAWHLLEVSDLKPEHRIDSGTLFELVKLAFGVVAGSGALVALVVAYRRQRVDEEAALREATRLHTERFTTAVSQLGDASAAVRLGGVHALAGLADDAPTDLLRQTCIDVLCACLRLPYTAESDLPPDDTAARRDYLSSREVRHTIIRLIRDRLATGREDTAASWQGYDLNCTEVVFDGGDFSGAVFSSGTADFRGAQFIGGTVNFCGAQFSGATVDFRGARFTEGIVDFTHAQFSGGRIDFARTLFSHSAVGFDRVRFSGGTVSFRSARFDGRVTFLGARFDGTVLVFHRARGHAPAGLQPAAGLRLPEGLRGMPAAWLPPAP